MNRPPRAPRAHLPEPVRPLRGAFPLLLLAALLLPACEGTVGPCPDGNCPTVPGCDDDQSVLCDAAHVCSERVCEGVGWICGLDELGFYTWLRKRAPCDDGDPCTEKDICVAGQCRGVKKSCNTPPLPSCSGPSTLLTYDSKGICQGGTCAYTPTTVSCPGSCKAGKCEGSPCTGVKCDNPPGVCYQKTGACQGGTCSYTPLAAGTACTPKDPCQKSATCDGKGTCSGTTVDCSRPHTSGGSCVGGACQGYQCQSGWGNCNSSWSDGCETSLNTTKNCGKCGTACTAGKNATASCSGGRCGLSCKAPYKDCDANPATGCEIPVGVANACSKSGVTYGSGAPTGCGTAYCGSSSSKNAANFGSWTCVFCEHCHYFSNGWSWCLASGSSPGTFSPDRCSGCCNSSKADKVCPK